MVTIIRRIEQEGATYIQFITNKITLVILNHYFGFSIAQSSTCSAVEVAHQVPSILTLFIQEKQAKNRNETGSNLRLGLVHT